MCKWWVSTIQKWVSIAETQPQLSSIQSQWIYLQRIIPDCGPLFKSIEAIITKRLLPTPFGCEISPIERHLLHLLFGWRVSIPHAYAHSNFHTPRKLTAYITSALKGNTHFDLLDSDDHCFDRNQ